MIHKIFGKYLLKDLHNHECKEIILSNDHSVRGLPEEDFILWQLRDEILLFMLFNGDIKNRFIITQIGWQEITALGYGPRILKKIDPYYSKVQPKSIIHFNPLNVSANNHNPALLRIDDNRILAAVRTGYYPDHSFIYLAVLDFSFAILSVNYIPFERIQDPKLFWYGGEIKMIHNLHGEPTVWMNTIIIRESRPVILWNKQIKLELTFPGKMDSLMEKNWAPFVYVDQLYFLYRRSPHIVIRFDDRIQNVVFDPSLVTDSCFDQRTYSILHGNGIPIRISEDFYLATFHNLSKPIRNYTIGYYLFESKPPFSIKRMCNEPLLTSEAIIQELICDDPGQTARNEYGYFNGSNLLFLSSALQEGESVIFTFGINDVRSAFLRYNICDLVNNTHEMVLYDIPLGAQYELGNVTIDVHLRIVKDILDPMRNGYLECGPNGCCVRWTNYPDLFTPVGNKLYLDETRLLSFEISNDCPLATIHPKCPINDSLRYTSSPIRTPISDTLIIETAIIAYTNFGFNGFITFWGYNEPLLHLDRELQIIKSIREVVPTAKFMILTNGISLSGEDFLIEKLLAFDLLVINNYTKDLTIPIQYLANFIQVIVNDTPFLDDRMLNYIGPLGNFDTKIGSCFKPNYEFIVDYYGNILMCCNDFRNENVIGNIQLQSLTELLPIWKRLIGYPNRMGISERQYEQTPEICKRCLINTPKTRLNDKVWITEGRDFFGKYLYERT